jgi:hypothetical protein
MLVLEQAATHDGSAAGLEGFLAGPLCADLNG